MLVLVLGKQLCAQGHGHLQAWLGCSNGTAQFPPYASVHGGRGAGAPTMKKACQILSLVF